MKRIKRFNESTDSKRTLRDLIGDVKITNNAGYFNVITETTKGCFTNFDNLDEILDDEVTIYRFTDQDSATGKAPYGEICSDNFRGYVYLNDNIPKIISSYPGDERGCVLFGDVFVSSGHDGSYLWNIKTGEFKSHSW